MPSATAEAVRDAAVPPDGPRGLPGASVRRVADVNVYSRDGQDWLSTSSVLKIMGLGRIPEHVPAAAIEYGRLRGAWVDEAVTLWIRAGRPPVGPYADALDAQLAAWREQDARWRNFRVRPYLEAAAAWLAGAEEIETQVLVEQPAWRTFGWVDLRAPQARGRMVADFKTSARLTVAHRLQVASYLGEDDRGVVVQLGKDGRPHPVEVTLVDVHVFATLASLAHAWVAEQSR